MGQSPCSKTTLKEKKAIGAKHILTSIWPLFSNIFAWPIRAIGSIVVYKEINGVCDICSEMTKMVIMAIYG